MLKPVSSPKPIYIRFDLNQYSIPPDAVGKQLTLAATDTQVRILDGSAVIATHRRSFDRGEVLEAPEYRKALLELRRKAQKSLGGVGAFPSLTRSDQKMGRAHLLHLRGRPLDLSPLRGQDKLLAFITEPAVMRRILNHLDRKTKRPRAPPKSSELNLH